jgi:hypothetical protein
VGLTVAGDQIRITNVGFGSYAKRTGLEAGYAVTAVLQPTPGRPSPLLIYVPALALAGLIWWLQRRRVPLKRADARLATAAAPVSRTA